MNYVCDVLIVGGGVSGTMAAISAARQGCSVTLIERGGCLGGMWTAGLVGITLDGQNKCELLDEFIKNVEDELKNNTATLFETQKYVLEKMLKNENIKIIYYSQIFELKFENETVKSVKYISKSLINEIHPKVVIDCTGDGDIAAMMGCEFYYGRPDDGKTQPMSMIALITGIDENVTDKYISSKDKSFWEARNNLKELLDELGISVSLGCASIVPLIKNIYILSINQEYGKNACSAEDVTNATIQARKEIFEFVKTLKEKSPQYFGDLMLLTTPEMIGVREGRRIKCKYMVTIDDMLEGKHHEDAVCTVYYWPDIHSPEKDEKGFSDGGLKILPYDIPFRALLPLKTENFLVAGRCIGGDFYAHSSYRVMGNMAAVGEAAGRMAAKSVKSCIPVTKIEYNKL